ncbi:hypothetical protein [Jiangella mangrovi]|uniref:Uncharacterized protein n=1 Tax=Jiangella mangrovi TaxID=1524084 RepID=A0A7W9GS22_9ACTN|nr:hypothetical protein [Jiangella mangrovi]MBB5788783.1 hypothetical protein [Jiangella mangrovi]
MAVDPAPLPLDDEALRAIGVIAVQSARVEWQLTGIRAVVDRSMSHEEHLRQGKAKAHAKTIRAYLQEHESWAGPEATAECIQWADEAAQLLFERGNLVHSGWVTTTDDDGVFHLTRRHMKTGDEYPFSHTDLEELGHKLGMLATTGHMFMAVAMTKLFDADE